MAIEIGADAVDIGKTIHPHPTLGESISVAAEVAHGELRGFATGTEIAVSAVAGLRVIKKQAPAQ